MAIRLPKRLVEKLELRPGDELEIVAAAGGRVELARGEAREQALAVIRARRWALPPGNRFGCDEANQR